MGIRAARHGDLEQLLPLLRGYCDFYDYTPRDEDMCAMALAVIEAPDDVAFLLVAEEEGELVGFALCQWKRSILWGGPLVVLDDLFVAESARERGHGTALLEAAAEFARGRGAAALNWLTAPDNHRAQRVYNKSGAHSEPFLEYHLPLTASEGDGQQR